MAQSSIASAVQPGPLTSMYEDTAGTLNYLDALRENGRHSLGNSWSRRQKTNGNKHISLMSCGFCSFILQRQIQLCLIFTVLHWRYTSLSYSPDGTSTQHTDLVNNNKGRNDSLFYSISLHVCGYSVRVQLYVYACKGMGLRIPKN